MCVEIKQEKWENMTIKKYKKKIRFHDNSKQEKAVNTFCCGGEVERENSEL
jgi:uncharacterized FAD-dependent dehydrogenase